MSKLLHLLTTTLVALTLLLWGNVGFAQYTGSGIFNKIASVEEIEDGYYVIANSTDAFAMNHTNAGKYFTHTAITPSEDVLANPATNIVWEVKKDGTNYTISYTDGADITYVSYTGSKNEAHAVVSTIPTDNQKWAVTIDAGVFKFENVATTTRLLQYNAGAPRFACYTSGQQDLILYKLAVGGVDTQAPLATFDPADADTKVALNVNPTITFDEPIYTSPAGALVDNTNVESLITFTDGTDPVTFSATIAENVITVVPTADLLNATAYTLTVAAIQDELTNAMDAHLE
jgi:hypothetical protein